MKEEELAEKRRLAPGWLDRDEKILQPSRANHAEGSPRDMLEPQSSNVMDRQNEEEGLPSKRLATPDPAGEALDRAFGSIDISNKSSSNRT